MCNLKIDEVRRRGSRLWFSRCYVSRWMLCPDIEWLISAGNVKKIHLHQKQHDFDNERKELYIFCTKREPHERGRTRFQRQTARLNI